MALTQDKLRAYAADWPEINIVLPVKAAQTIYAGAALELNGGYLENASGAGTFAGFALEPSAAVAGESDGDRAIKVRVQGAIELDITTDTVAQSNVGGSAISIEATDNDTFRIETGSAVTGQTVGLVSRVITPGVAGRVLVSFKGAMVA
jgi:hypothetical protein